MGNAVASSIGCRRVKIMKLDGEILKFKAPLTVGQLLLNYPEHVILHSDAVRHAGVKANAKPLEGSTQLNPKQLYILLEMPKIEDIRAPRKVRSDINMSAKSRLEAMLLARRSSSDIGALNSSYISSSSLDGGNSTVRLQVRLTKAQLAELESQSQNSSETAQKILDFFLSDRSVPQNLGYSQSLTETSGLRSSLKTCPKTEKNHVRFSSNSQTAEVF